MKIVLAIDSFKGSLTSQETEKAVAESIKTIYPACDIHCIPVSDGGEGCLSILMKWTNGIYIPTQAHDPLMRITPTEYGLSYNDKIAFIEMARINSLTFLSQKEKNPMETTTFGTGELIKAGLEKGCRQFIIGIGGSATNDAGTGLLQALGYRFFDKNGNELGQGGEILSKIAHIDDTQKHPLLEEAKFLVACDVQNPFYGVNGAAYIYARQKGADENMIAELDKGMQSFANIIYKKTGKNISNIPGSGAAGGLGGGIYAFLNAELKSGADLILELCHFEECITDANLVITGEGKIDKQSLMGKIPGKILQASLRKKVPVIAIAGIAEDINTLHNAGFKRIYTTKPDYMTLEEAMQPDIATYNIQRTIAENLLTELNFG